MKEINIAITAASYSGNKGAAAMLQSSITQLKAHYGEGLHITLMSVYPREDREQCPHKFVTVIPAEPQRILFFAFPMAVLYHMFSFCPPIRHLLLKNKILNAYRNTDYVIDEAGISFADSRGFVMNAYAFATLAVPMLLDVPVVKYSQAMGPFRNPYNRFLAGLLLPRLRFIGARGRMTYENLMELGLKQRVRLVADGAFTMPEENQAARAVKARCRKWGFSNVVGVAVSSVVARKCRKARIDYCNVMVDFIIYLNRKGYKVCLLANAARIHSKQLRNNDLPTADAICKEYHRRMGRHADGLYWVYQELSAEELRAWIGQCRFLVSSRFHAMVFALSEQVPVMLIGWSHKYQEVMEQFGLEEFAADYVNLELSELKSVFETMEREEGQIRKKIAVHLPKAIESSYGNIQGIVDCFSRCKMGYAKSEKARKNAASGGVVTALLCHLLRTGEIDGAWVTKAVFTDDGTLSYRTWIATTETELLDASSSVYLSIPMMKHLQMLRDFDGKIAVVLIPCMMRAFVKILEREPDLRKKVILKIGLFCSGGFSKEPAEYAMEKAGIRMEGAKRFYYRRGHWRGKASVVYEDGSEQSFSYAKTICAYKNAGFFMNQGCLSCQDHFCRHADISFGDVWLPKMKQEPVKYTGMAIRSAYAEGQLEKMEDAGEVVLKPLSAGQMIQSQKRALALKYRKKWNHRLAGLLTQYNRELSRRNPELVRRLPMRFVYLYMCFLRFLLSW